MLSSAASAEEECSDLVPPRGTGSGAIQEA